MGTAGLLGMLSQFRRVRSTATSATPVTSPSRSSGSGAKRWPLTRRSGSGAARATCARSAARAKPSWSTRAAWSSTGARVLSSRPWRCSGPNLDIYDLEPITEANYLCNRFGLDTIAAGGTIAALMEIFGIAQAKPAGGAHRGRAGADGGRCRVRAARCGAGRRRSGGMVRAGVRQRAGARPAGARHGPRRGGARARAGIRGAAPGRALRSPRGGDGREGDGDPGLRSARHVDAGDVLHDHGARGGCHLQGGYSAPIAFCAGYGEFPGIKSEGAALIARNFAYQNTAYDVLGVCAFAGFSVTLDEYANMLNDVTGLGHEGERSRDDLPARADARAPVQSPARLHARGRLAPRALLQRPDRDRGGDGRLPRGGLPRDARRVPTSRLAGTSGACRAPRPITGIGLDAVLPAGVRADGGRHAFVTASARHAGRGAEPAGAPA